MSPPQANVRLRSANGCWTCRVRKKKCDETHPTCAACNVLGIDCHGYGPRPAWMDKGGSERAELERIKNIILNRSSKKTHRRRQSHFVEPLRHSITPTNARPSSSVSEEEPASPNTPHTCLITPVSTSNGPCDISKANSIFNFDNSLVDEMDSSLSLLPEYPTSMLDTRILGIEDDSVFSFGESYHPGSSSSSMTSDALEPAGVAQGQPPTPIPTEMAAATRVTSSVPHVLQDLNMFSMDNLMCSATDFMDDALLIAYYTDNIYEIQFPFIISDVVRRDESRWGWLLYLLFRSSVARNLAVVLAEAHQSIKNNSGPIEQYSHFVRLARQLVTKQPCPSMPTTPSETCQKPFDIIELCFAHVQIMILQTLCGKYMDWARSLREAARPLRVLIDILQKDASMSDNTKILNNMHVRIANMVLAYHLWFDLLAASFFRQKSLLGVDIDLHLKFCANELRALTGCEVWVIQCIRDVLDLDVWRYALETQKCLSIIELAQRGLVINERLKHGIAGLQKKDKTTTGSNTAITSIFAQSAAIYLNVVCSGPNPALLEICAAVSRVVKGLYSITHTSNLSTAPILAWPLCLAGCLVGYEGRTELWGILTDSQWCDGAQRSRGQISRIVEECWRIRTDKEQDCDWSSAIRSLQATRQLSQNC